MAGAGKKTFVAGEVLTAAQVNDYLMDQAVMRFSGSAARAASITAPTEGMVTYLDDANRIEIYDGSAWQQVPTDQDDVRNLVTGSAQVLIGAAAASVVALGGAAEGQVLTAASAQPGGLTWATPAGAGAAVYFTVAATGVTALPVPIPAGFYRISTGDTASFTQAEFRFMDSAARLYGASISNGLGLSTIPVEAASINITTGTVPFNLLIEELAGVTTTLPQAPTVTDFEWTDLRGGSAAFTTVGTPTRMGYYEHTTGSLISTSVVTSPFSNLFFTASTQAFDTDASFNLVQQNALGLWSTTNIYSASAFDGGYPWTVFTANGTYVPTTASVDVLVVGGGGGGGHASQYVSVQSGGGGAGGASVWFNRATPASVAVTVGAGGAGGTYPAGNGSPGNSSAFGSASITGGGGGARSGNPGATGLAGASGGGGSLIGANPGGAGTTGGNPGGSSSTASGGTGGGGGGKSATGGTGPGHGGAGATTWGFSYAGGGGGGYDNTATNGGLGGGAPGGRGSGGPSGSPSTGGGGGGVREALPGTAGAGGSGVVIVKVIR